nr:MurR/RpiR family transcriptional regulator [Brevundimonas naejangsanensis]
MTPNDSLSATARESQLIALIAEVYPSLSDGHRRVADVILSSPHEAALMRLTDLAEAAGVSQATANRFSTRLGLDGHPELKRRLHSELRQALRSLDNFSEVMTEQRSNGDPWNQSLDDDATRIRQIAPLGGLGQFAQASARLATARKVFIAGFGSSAYLAQYAAYCLLALRPNVEAVVDSSGVEGVNRRVLDAGPEDVALQIVFARYSEPALTLTAMFRKLTTPIIGLTDGPESPLTPLSDISIIVPRKPGFVLSGGGAGAMAALDALLRGTANSLGEEAVLRRSARLTSLLGASVIAPP